MLVENKLARSCAPGVTGETVLMELLDAVIDRNADWRRRRRHGQYQPPHFGARGPPPGHAKRYSDILIAIGRKGDLTSKVPGSLVLRRVVTFCRRTGVKWSGDSEQRKPCSATVSLTDPPLSLQQDHLRAGCDARRQSRAEQHHQAVFGDGGGVDAADLDCFDLRHEFQADAGAGMTHGYPMALVMMLLAAVLPYLFFTWKKWL
jgi:magnesium transporter